MLRRLLCLAFASGLAGAATPRGCVGSLAVTTFRLSVQPAGAGTSFIPIRRVNNIASGYRIAYQPVDLPADLKKDAKLTLVVVPKASEGQLTVLEPRLAANPTEWSAPFVARLVLLVFAPQGLDEKRLTNLVTKDDNLVASLADYADQTAELEAGIEAANLVDQLADEDLSKPVRTTPAEQAIFALVRSLNPAVSSYDPLGAGRRVGSATALGKGVGTFFENAGGIVPGGGALPMVKSWLLPDTEFRSVYGLSAEADAMTLCAQLQPKSRNKIAYLWAYRLTGSGPPPASILKDAHVPLTMRASVPLKLEKAADWRLLDKVFDWNLVPEGGSAPLPVVLRPVFDDRALQLDLRKFAGGPGSYRIEGKWDWGVFRVNGTVRLHRFDDLKTAQVTAESRDKLVSGAGPVAIELADADFLFVDRVTLHRPASARQIPIDLPPDRSGPFEKLQVEVETDGLRPGPYLLALSRIDGGVTDVPFRLLPPNPKLDASPPRVNLGDAQAVVTFSGAGLDRLEKLECDRAEIALAAPGDDPTKRNATIRLSPAARPGDRLTLTAKVEGITGTLRFLGALQVAAARPKIREARASLPRDLVVATQAGEVPAGSWVSFAIKVEPADVQPLLTVQCVNPAHTILAAKIRPGEKLPGAQLAPAGAGAFFLSLDPGTVGQSGCALTASVETDALGKSDVFALGTVVRLPRVESFTVTDEKSPDGYYGWVKGFDLESIEKTGWDVQTGLATAELPRPLAGEGAKQILRISMPWPSPSPKAPLYLWLRGETSGRATKITQ